ncbi:coniferyl aldehyde dehydrogenase [Parachitinimonas caeni]|uniref:Aldehyde dehydrogenase n=1 Tax=Parachitinimonas caeni TaxID=3031301 RepID=A0ABT7DYP4_9NEIS|nr:coniferyl aldehyde dehydrogenase [Parachitinimonas caeni]MDK2124178.1 coniferyl aldehyde dehydrogenase [Parachitinimonas caeni]
MEPGFQPHQAEAQVARLQAVFSRQRAAWAAAPYPGREERRQALVSLREALLRHADEFCAAISADFGHRSAHETRVLELFPCIEGIRHAEKSLKKWMKSERRPVSKWFMPASNTLIAQPLGVVGIIVPWNYPLYLAIGPLTSALAAGNRVMLKMSEFTPRTGELLARVLSECFHEDQVVAFNGGVEVAQVFSSQPFDHILFTGSTSVGKHVMRAASEHLTPVTLELGGKSPTLVGPEFSVKTAAERILHGKCLNAGQTCVAPDYVFVPEARLAEFVEAAKVAVNGWYPNLPANPDYSAVINERHRHRLEGYLTDAKAQGATIIPLVEGDCSHTGKMAPTIVTGVSDAMKIMQDEIFGPLLPVMTYRNFDEAIAYVNAHPRPLALYLFDYDRERISYVLSHTISGGVALNETVVHVAQDDLPFGGVGPSGMGAYHGKEGFDTFSKKKGVFAQSRVNGLSLLRPPYGKTIETMIKFMLR